jgi:hypothetical protein
MGGDRSSSKSTARRKASLPVEQLDVEYKQMHLFKRRLTSSGVDVLKSVYEKYMPEDDEDVTIISGGNKDLKK